jgi:hypothetical protein
MHLSCFNSLLLLFVGIIIFLAILGVHVCAVALFRLIVLHNITHYVLLINL